MNLIGTHFEGGKQEKKLTYKQRGRFFIIINLKLFYSAKD